MDTNSVIDDCPQLLTTNEFAFQQRAAPQTIRKNYCVYGHHHGAIPIKQPNGRLLWHKGDLIALLTGGKHV